MKYIYIYCITSRHSQNSLFPIDFGTRIITLPVYLVSTSIIIPVWTIRCTPLVIPICTIHNCALLSHLVTPIGIVTHCIATDYRSDSFVFDFDAKLAPTHTILFACNYTSSVILVLIIVIFPAIAPVLSLLLSSALAPVLFLVYYL